MRGFWLALAPVLVVSTAAHAEVRRPVPEEHPNLVGVELDARFGITDAQSESFADDLEGYGYGALTSTGISMWAGYELIPFIDAGLVADYWSRDEGSARGSDDMMKTDARQLAVFTRLKMRHPSGRLVVASRFDLGGVHARSSLRGHAVDDVSFFWRVRTELAVGSARTKALVHFSYQGQTGADGFEPFTPPRTGGPGIGLGLMHRF